MEIFVGILSAGNYFTERMAVRKSWMQHKLVRSSKVVTRFFVALHARKEVNVELKKEANFFGYIDIVPYMDNYDLVVLKTVAICEHGVRTLSAKYVMKCDDDTFVRLDAVLDEVRKVANGKSLYIGNIDFYRKPQRYVKWAVTYEELPEEEYPPCANGPGYVPEIKAVQDGGRERRHVGRAVQLPETGNRWSACTATSSASSGASKTTTRSLPISKADDM